MRVFLGAFGDPGHAFPALALGEALVQAGHEVCLQTWRKWTLDAEAAGIEFAPAPEYQVFPTPDRPLKPYEAAVMAARETVPVVEAFRPDVAVADILTIAPALAAELCGVPVTSLVPHVHPDPPPGHPPYSIGARAPRTAGGRAFWGRVSPITLKGLERGRREYNAARARLDLPPRAELHTGLSRGMTMVATLPQLEYPRSWPPWLRVVGPLMWEPPAEGVEPPPGEGPVVLVAPSTAHDPDRSMLLAALDALADEPVRVIATWNGEMPAGVPVPGNAVLVQWLSYSKTMPHCDVVISHAGHGTVMRALENGCALVCTPAAGDMGENAARVDWAGLGVRVPRRLVGRSALRLAVRRVLADEGIRARTRAVATWMAANDGRDTAVGALERYVNGSTRRPAAR